MPVAAASSEEASKAKDQPVSAAVALYSFLPSLLVHAWMPMWTVDQRYNPRESAPLWVGLTFALMIVGTIMYVTGYFMIEDLLAYVK
jgi:succinate dehydrogenase hydrophobic anchor subunit